MGFQITPIVKYLLIINVLFLVLGLVAGDQLTVFMGLWYVESSKFYPWQFITYMFAHADFFHLFGNMLGLLIFGGMLERVWGAQRFLIFYMICGIGAAAVHTGIRFWEIETLNSAVEQYIASPSGEAFQAFLYDHAKEYYYHWQDFREAFENNPTEITYINESVDRAKGLINFAKESFPMVGASGAVMGVVMAFALLFPNTELILLFPPIPIKAKYFALMYIAFDVFGIIRNAPGDNVAHFAHLGGMFFGFFLVQYWKTHRDRFY